MRSRVDRSPSSIALKYCFTNRLLALISEGMRLSLVPDHDLAEVLARAEVRERRARRLKGEHAVDDWVHFVKNERSVHLLEVTSAAESDRPKRGLAQEEVDQAHAGVAGSQHAYQGDFAFVGH